MTEKEEDLATIALLEFFNAVEAGIASAKQMIGNKKGVTPHADYNTAGWTTVKGTKGDYEQVSRQLAKQDVFDRLQMELKDHNGFWAHGGYKYWFHQNDQDVIDRRKS